jgi:hypothetical protein
MEKKITDKIKEILTESDLKLFEEAIQKMISDRVTIIEEELKKKYDSLAEEYVAKEIAKGIEVEKAKLVEEYDSKINTLEKKVVSKLDSFLDHVIVEQISDATIEKIAINEVFAPVVEGIKKVYAENFIELKSDGSKKIQESTEKITTLEKQLSEAMAKLLESEERLEKTATYLLISEKTTDLTQTQRERVLKMFKDKHFDEVKEKIDTFVDIVKESTEKTEKEVTTEKVETPTKVDDVLTEEEHIPETKKVVAEKVETEKAPSFIRSANSLL